MGTIKKRIRDNGDISIPRVPLKIWIDRYITDIIPTKVNGKNEFYFLNFWKTHLGDQIAVDITPEMIECLTPTILKIKSRIGEGISAETVRKYFMYLGYLYNIAIKHWKWAVYSPLAGVEVHRNMISKKKRAAGFLKDPDADYIQKWRENYLSLVNKTLKEKKLSVRGLAKQAGMTNHTVQSGIMEQCNPTLQYLLKVIKALGLKITISSE